MKVPHGVFSVNTLICSSTTLEITCELGAAPRPAYRIRSIRVLGNENPSFGSPILLAAFGLHQEGQAGGSEDRGNLEGGRGRSRLLVRGKSSWVLLPLLNCRSGMNGILVTGRETSCRPGTVLVASTGGREWWENDVTQAGGGSSNACTTAQEDSSRQEDEAWQRMEIGHQGGQIPKGQTREKLPRSRWEPIRHIQDL